VFKALAVVAVVAVVALVAEVAVVALVAVAEFPVQEPEDPVTLPVTLPVKAAVIVPAVKLPDASRATIVDAVLAEVALDVTVKVAAPDWLAVKV
jgi:hypothetical protein